ncbi:hypothetical protein [Silicimonas algicola]|nr:hypothetical protein [Silicimonas algicola]
MRYAEPPTDRQIMERTLQRVFKVPSELPERFAEMLRHLDEKSSARAVVRDD